MSWSAFALLLLGARATKYPTTGAASSRGKKNMAKNGEAKNAPSALPPTANEAPTQMATTAATVAMVERKKTKIPIRANVGGHRHATHAAKRQLDVACPRGPTN